MNQCLDRFIILVGHLISPHPVHGFASFQRQPADALSRKARFVFTRQVALEYLNVLSVERCLMMVVPYQTSRLKPMNQFILSGKFPIESGILILIPPSVEPNSAYGSVVGQQFRQLIIHELIISRPVSFRIRASRTTSGTPPRIIFPCPVEMRVIEMEFDTVFGASIRQFFRSEE